MIYPDDFINKIICGDCLKFMKKIPDESVDLIIADPPFNVGLNYGNNFNDKKDSHFYWEWIQRRIKQIYRVLKKDTRFYIFHTDKGIFKLKPICEKAGFKFHQLLTWFGPNLIGKKTNADWAYTHESILLFHKGKKTNMLSAYAYGVTTFSVQVHARPQSNFRGGRDHVAQKPISLLASIIARSPGQIILDPFCGVGTSLVAAKDLKRDYIGIEINPDYCKIAEDRLRQGVL